MSFFLHALKESGQLKQVHMNIGIVGSRKVSNRDDYGSGNWEIFAPNLTIYGFDADLDACEEANAEIAAQQPNWQEKHIPIALSSTVGEACLYVTNHLTCTSLYPPNTSYLKRFAIIPNWFRLDCSIEIETTTLDTYCQEEEIETLDFLQIDVQGADLHILEGASSLLERSVLGIQTEVEFSPLYINQPLFADIDTFLRKRDFTLFDIVSDDYMSRCHRASSPVRSTLRAGQLLWADAYYLRDLIRDDINSPLKTPDNILKLACIADILQFPDYALELLEYLTIHYGDEPRYNFAECIITSLSQIPEFVEQGLDSFPVVANIRHRLK